MKYFVTISWPDESQPLLRQYDSVTADIRDLSSLSAWEVLEAVKYENMHIRHKDIAVNFMMALGE